MVLLRGIHREENPLEILRLLNEKGSRKLAFTKRLPPSPSVDAPPTNITLLQELTLNAS
jgi:hypothetical protein